MSHTRLELPSKDNRGEDDHTMAGSFELQWMLKFVSYREKRKRKARDGAPSFNGRLHTLRLMS